MSLTESAPSTAVPPAPATAPPRRHGPHHRPGDDPVIGHTCTAWCTPSSHVELIYSNAAALHERGGIAQVQATYRRAGLHVTVQSVEQAREAPPIDGQPQHRLIGSDPSQPYAYLVRLTRGS